MKTNESPELTSAREIIFSHLPGVRRTACQFSPMRHLKGHVLYLTEPGRDGGRLRANTARRVTVRQYSSVALRATLRAPLDGVELEVSFLADEAQSVAEWLQAREQAITSGASIPELPCIYPRYHSDGNYVWTSRAWEAEKIREQQRKKLSERRAQRLANLATPGQI